MATTIKVRMMVRISNSLMTSHLPYGRTASRSCKA
jgi:hypothetical protein